MMTEALHCQRLQCDHSAEFLVTNTVSGPELAVCLCPIHAMEYARDLDDANRVTGLDARIMSIELTLEIVRKILAANAPPPPPPRAYTPPPPPRAPRRVAPPRSSSPAVQVGTHAATQLLVFLAVIVVILLVAAIAASGSH